MVSAIVFMMDLSVDCLPGFTGRECRRIQPMPLVLGKPRRHYVPRSGAAAGADEQAKSDQAHQRARIFGCYQHGPSRIIRSSRWTCRL